MKMPAHNLLCWTRFQELFRRMLVFKNPLGKTLTLHILFLRSLPLAWVPAKCIPAHNNVWPGSWVWGRSVGEKRCAVRTNQIVRAGFIQWWTDDRHQRNQPPHQRALGLNSFSTNNIGYLLWLVVGLSNWAKHLGIFFRVRVKHVPYSQPNGAAYSD